MSYITGLGGTPGPGWFTDNLGNPKLWVATETWGLPIHAGLNSSGNWQGDYDTFFAQRAAQGFTVMMTDPVWASGSFTTYGGNTWDGLTPLTGGGTDPSTGLNSTFWARIDYMLSSAESQGITVGLVVNNVGDDTASGIYGSWSTTEWTEWGTALGNRYKNTPNLIWLIGNDAFSPYSDTVWNAAKSGITGTGDTHLWSAWYNAECTSRYDTSANTAEPWGVSNASFDFCYTYNAGYWAIEYAYLEVADEGAASLLPVIWGDGYFSGDSSGQGYDSTLDRAMRQEWWWCLASGARGILGEAENVYPWQSGAAAAVTGDWFFANNAPNIVTAFSGLTGWHKLIPDTGNALVTAGRGTRVTGYTSGGSGGQYEPAFTNSYVAASKTPDGTLAVMYLPAHATITVNQSLLPAGYTATWIDPVSGAKTAATTGSTYNSTAKGTNSQGDPDWVLVLQGQQASTPPPHLYSMRRFR